MTCFRVMQIIISWSKEMLWVYSYKGMINSKNSLVHSSNEIESFK